jgi:putative PIN family toxin of toxin-antitoxin system
MTLDLVLDTNVVLDWLVFGDPAVQALAQALEDGHVRWVATAPMLDELRHVLRRPLDARWEARRELALTFALDNRVEIVSPPDLPPARRLHCTDADDQKFIDLALARPTPWLLTRDRALLRLARRARLQGVAVVPPGQWRLA